tara:strand:- start:2309 stop:2443 length:135 start_codon:yes stop_codon:yes gene_type:complete
MIKIAQVAELVDAPASGAGLYYIGGGSSPLLGTNSSLNKIIIIY